MILVNLYGGPGAGKSTLRAEIFKRLKVAGVNCEEVPEAAKRYTWEKRYTALACQPYLFGKQLHETEALVGQVDVVITDSPLMLCCLYADLSPRSYPESFKTAMIDIAKSFTTMDYMIERVMPYQHEGRGQSSEDADNIGRRCKELLTANDIPFSVFPGDVDVSGEPIANEIIARLNSLKSKEIDDDE